MNNKKAIVDLCFIVCFKQVDLLGMDAYESCYPTASKVSLAKLVARKKTLVELYLLFQWETSV